MYCLMTDSGAPTTLPTKSLGCYSTGSLNFARNAGNSLRRSRLATVLTLFATTLGAHLLTRRVLVDALDAHTAYNQAPIPSMPIRQGFQYALRLKAQREALLRR